MDSHDFPFASPTPSPYTRSFLPQISDADLDEFVEFIRSQGTKVRGPEMVNTHVIQPSQTHIDLDKVRRIISSGLRERTLILAEDYRLLDGHHHIYAAKILGEDWTRCMIAECGIHELVSIGHLFSL